MPQTGYILQRGGAGQLKNAAYLHFWKGPHFFPEGTTGRHKIRCATSTCAVNPSGLPFGDEEFECMVLEEWVERLGEVWV